jgi:hypothetical protein
LTFKEKVHKRCQELINDKVYQLKKTLGDLKETASNETKSTAGDKHETALAMIQIEQENTNKQLKEALTQKLQFERIDSTIHSVKVANGSLVETNKGYFFISVALGKLMIDNNMVVALSPQSPLGNKLLGLNENDTTTMNGVNYVIEHIE